MVKKDIGWYFPPSNGGLEDGYNDSGIATFKGAPFPSLARETIQNSVDAIQNAAKPVQVIFELVDINREDIGAEELSAVIVQCLEEVEELDDERVQSELEICKNLLANGTISCLRISDRNTTGLTDRLWRSLVKTQGVSVKPGLPGAGGSHGIGKSAPFVVSGIRTVFYWTCYKKATGVAERFQGKSILMSHNSSEGRTQGTGFYGYKNGCQDIKTGDILDGFRELNQNKEPIEGTSLLIAGFRSTKGWRHQIAVGVVENFFYAIGNDKLTVMIEPEESDTLDFKLEITKDTLSQWLDHLDGELQEENDLHNRVLKTMAFMKLENDNDVITVERQDPTFGHCKLLIKITPELPRGVANRVGFIRRSGMLITTEQNKLKRFPGYDTFVALCVFEDPKGNELLRRMENPQHDQFEPDRLPVAEQENGRRGLASLTTWIRNQIKKHAGPPQGGNTTVLRELATVLPDIYPDEDFDHSEYGDGSREPGFGEKVVVTLRPIRRLVPPSIIGNEEEDVDGGGEDACETSGGEGQGGGQGGVGGNGDQEGRRGKRIVPISGVRILPVRDTLNRLLIFTAEDNGPVQLQMEEAGDSSRIPRDDIRILDGPLLGEYTIDLVKGKPYHIKITSNKSMEGRAWRLLAVARSEE